MLAEVRYIIQIHVFEQNVTLVLIKLNKVCLELTIAAETAS